jgi:Icc-related predicted phosphoesterase
VHLCLGDIVTFKPLSYLDELFAHPPIRTHALPGNTDTPDARARLGELGLDLHFKRTEVKGVAIAGAGGCPPPPFRTAFVVEEEEYRERLPPLLVEAQVLATHAPARGFLDTVLPGVHVGGRALREAIEAARPQVVLSGHIHQADGIVLWDWAAGRPVLEAKRAIDEDLRERTLFLNPGAASGGRLAELELKGHRVKVVIIGP